MRVSSANHSLNDGRGTLRTANPLCIGLFRELAKGDELRPFLATRRCTTRLVQSADFCSEFMHGVAGFVVVQDKLLAQLRRGRHDDVQKDA